jgi:hypothetical protein
MSALLFTCCAECGKKLRTTFFCQECGQPSCSIDCYCRHESRHSEMQQPATDRQEAEGADIRVEEAR